MRTAEQAMVETKSYYILKAIRCGDEWAQEVVEAFIDHKTIPDKGDDASYLLAIVLSNIQPQLYDWCCERYDEYCTELILIHNIHFTLHIQSIEL